MEKESFVTFRIHPTEDALLITEPCDKNVSSPFEMLDSIGTDEAAKMIGRFVLSMLAIDQPDRFAAYPNLIIKPERGPTQEEIRLMTQQFKLLDDKSS